LSLSNPSVNLPLSDQLYFYMWPLVIKNFATPEQRPKLRLCAQDLIITYFTKKHQLQSTKYSTNTPILKIMNISNKYRVDE